MGCRYLGRTGVKISPFCLGTDCFMGPILEKQCAKMLNADVEAGINLIDTGDS
jgi:aryl-alcohol dehydrogenase-like predicted oxidoreductase